MDERNRDRDRKRKQRSADRDVYIPKIVNPSRKARCKKNVYKFLRTYFPDLFYTPFTDNRREIVESILGSTKSGSDQAIAAPRGEGKTTIVECVIIYCINMGLLRFPVICAATGPDADRILTNIKLQYETNDLLMEDWPEICAPIRALEGSASRARMQTVKGKRTLMQWAGSQLVFPTVAKSKASGAVLMTRGLDAAIRGLRYGALRPDIVIIDDPETRESVESDIQTKRRIKTIEQDIGGLGGPGQKLSRLMLCTIMNRRCIAFQYTDPKDKPSWDGKRYHLVDRFPDRTELWEKYMELRQQSMVDGDKTARLAHQFYLDNREEMDAGAIVTNPYRFIDEVQYDGSQLEVSAIQHCYNLIADRGFENFVTEYQNEPPEENEPEESGITADLVRRRLNGIAQAYVPNDTDHLVAFIDVGKWRLHWIVLALKAGFNGKVVEYGEKRTAQPDVIGTEQAILTALREQRDDWENHPYKTTSDHEFPLSFGLVDSGDWNTTVFEFVNESSEVWNASMGDSQYRHPTQRTRTKIPGTDHWYWSLQDNESTWVVNMCSDYWKHFAHARLMTEPFDDVGNDRPGAITLFGDDFRVHGNFAQQVTAEVWTRQYKDGKGLKEWWNQVRRDNHYLDCIYGACVAGSVCDVRLNPEFNASDENEEKPEPANQVQTPDGRPFFVNER